MFALLTLAMVQNVQIINSRCCNIIFFFSSISLSSLFLMLLLLLLLPALAACFLFLLPFCCFLPLVLPFCAFVWASEWQWCIVNELSMLLQQYSKTAAAEIKCGKKCQVFVGESGTGEFTSKKRNGQAKTPKKVRICHEPKWTELLLNGIITKIVDLFKLQKLIFKLHWIW